VLPSEIDAREIAQGKVIVACANSSSTIDDSKIVNGRRVERIARLIACSDAKHHVCVFLCEDVAYNLEVVMYAPRADSLRYAA
jgi:hypothetical protein